MYKIKLFKESSAMFTYCQFCDGMIPVNFKQDHDCNLISISGQCKKCKTKMYIESAKDHFMLIDDPLRSNKVNN